MHVKYDTNYDTSTYTDPLSLNHNFCSFCFLFYFIFLLLQDTVFVRLSP